MKNEVVYTPDAKALTVAIIATAIDVFICDPFVKTHGVPETIIARLKESLDELFDRVDPSRPEGWWQWPDQSHG